MGAAFAEYYDETFPAKRQLRSERKLNRPYRLEDRAFDNVTRTLDSRE
jgi:hypothetical protein